MLAECRWCPDQCIGPLDFQFRREPRLVQDSHLSPLRWGKIVLRRQVSAIMKLSSEGRAAIT
jgi:hypothetical protein